MALSNPHSQHHPLPEYQPQREKTRESKPKTSSQTKTKLNYGFWLMALVSLLAILTVFNYTQGALLNYEIAQTNQNISEITTRINYLNYNVAQESSLKGIEEKAVSMGFIKPNYDQNFYIKKGRV